MTLQYDIVTADSAAELRRKVQAKVEAGWVPSGGLVVQRVFYQAMTHTDSLPLMAPPLLTCSSCGKGLDMRLVFDPSRPPGWEPAQIEFIPHDHTRDTP